MPMIRKPLADITKDDLEALCREEALEDEQLDFKATIPHREAVNRDPWHVARDIKEHGRNQLLQTVVAFANSYGGDLIVGIRESPGMQPGKAEALTPLPNAADAADRLGRAARDCIDPPLVGFNLRAVPTDDVGAGVVVMRVPRSRNAPHRLTPTKDCYHRVRHETVPMTMRQIQELTFSVARGLDAVEHRFGEMRSSFRAWTDSSRDASKKLAWYRVTCVPSSADCYVDRVHGVEAVRPQLRESRLEIAPGTVLGLAVPLRVYNWQPILRGSSAGNENARGRERVRVFSDGAITYEWLTTADIAEDDEAARRGRWRNHALHPGWLFAVLVNAIESADRFRTHAGASAVEYALELEISVTAELPISRFGTASWFDAAGNLPGGVHIFPRYTVASKDTWPGLLNLIWRDFWNSIGIHEGNAQMRLDPP